MTIGARTRFAAVLGCPVEHSKSPAIHNAGFRAAGIDAVYVALEVLPADLGTVVKGLGAAGMLGASVTVPHKTAVMDFCDEISDTARAIGAVNTLVRNEAGGLIGHNTDAPGYVRSFDEETGSSIAGRHVVLLGGGGAARAVAQGVAEAGAASVQVIVRSPDKLSWTQASPWTSDVLKKACQSCGLLVDCTSMGLNEGSEAKIPEPIPTTELPKDAIVSTLVYHRETALLRDAKAQGLTTLNGAGMLLYQGAIAFELWTGTPAPIDVMRKAMIA